MCPVVPRSSQVVGGTLPQHVEPSMSVWKRNSVSDVVPSAPSPASSEPSDAMAGFSSSRPIMYQPFAGCDPLSVITIASNFGSSAICCRTYAIEPSMPSSSSKQGEPHSTRGTRCNDWIARATSITLAAPVPLSCAPVPGCHESRCASTIATSSGASLPISQRSHSAPSRLCGSDPKRRTQS